MPVEAPYRTVRHAWREWEKIGASEFALRQIRFGAQLPWTQPPSSLPRRFANAYKLSPSNAAFADAEVDRWVALGYAREISFEAARRQHIVSAAFVVNGSKDRLVIDYSPHVNPYLDAPKFRMETLLDLAPQIRPDDSLFKFDLVDGYYHVGNRRSDQTFLSFRVGRRFFLPLCLNCGLRCAPFIFTKFLRPMVQELRRLQHAVISYLDDIGGSPRAGLAEAAHSTAADAKVAKAEVSELASRLGVQIHPVKQDFSGSKALDLLGILVDTKHGLYLLSPEKLHKVRASALAVQRESRRRRRFVGLKHLRSFAGLAQSTHLAVTDARLHLRAIWDDIAAAERRRSGFVRLSHQACRDLMWWVQLRDNPGVGRAIWEAAQGQRRLIHSDANDTGWGAVLEGYVPARGMFSPPEEVLHINEKELLAVIYGVLSFARSLRAGLHIKQWVDSSVAAAQIFNWTSTSPIALSLLRILRRLLEDLGVSLSTQRLPSVLNLLSDRLSRMRPADDWKLTTDAVDSLVQYAGPVQTHHFAVRLTAVARRYTSRLADPYAASLALQAPWRAGDLLTPPPHALPLVLARLRDAPAPGVMLVTPDWPAQPWFALASRIAALSWALPFPAWTRGGQLSSWAGRVFIMGDRNSPKTIRRQLPGAQQVEVSPATDLGAQLVPLQPPGLSVPQLPFLLQQDTAEIGTDLLSTAALKGSLRFPQLRKQSPAISDICMMARESLAAVFGSTSRP